MSLESVRQRWALDWTHEGEQNMSEYNPYPDPSDRPWSLDRELSAAGFFYKHAGFSYGPDETPAQGRARCSRDLARAELEAEHRGWGHVVEADPDVMDDDAGSRELVESGEAINLGVVLVSDEHPPCPHNVLGSLWGAVVADESDPYIRVVAAELALEALTDV